MALRATAISTPDFSLPLPRERIGEWVYPSLRLISGANKVAYSIGKRPGITLSFPISIGPLSGVQVMSRE